MASRRRYVLLGLIAAMIVAAVVGGALAAQQSDDDPVPCDGPDLFAVRTWVDNGVPRVSTVARGWAPEAVRPGWLLNRPSFSPDGRRLVAVRATKGNYESAGPEEEELWVMDVDGSDARALTRGGVATWPAWSPDGDAVVFTERRPDGYADLAVVAVDGKSRPRRLLAEDDGKSTSPAWSPDGSTIAFLHGDELVTVATDGSRREVIAEVAAVTPASSLAWHPDGGSVVVSHGALTMVDVATGEQVLVGDGVWARWSPDGDRLYYSDATQGIGVIDARGSQPLTVPARFVPAFSDPDRRFANASFDVTRCQP